MLPWLPVFLYAALIFIISSLSEIGFMVPVFVLHFDPETFTMHLLEYIPFGFLLGRAVYRTEGLKKFQKIYFPTLLGVFYGLTDEIHQYYVPGRTASPYDALADSIGVLIGVGLFISMGYINFKKRE